MSRRNDAIGVTGGRVTRLSLLISPAPAASRIAASSPSLKRPVNVDVQREWDCEAGRFD
jgi:hypothetical protein